MSLFGHRQCGGHYLRSLSLSLRPRKLRVDEKITVEKKERHIKCEIIIHDDKLIIRDIYLYKSLVSFIYPIYIHLPISIDNNAPLLPMILRAMFYLSFNSVTFRNQGHTLREI